MTGMMKNEKKNARKNKEACTLGRHMREVMCLQLVLQCYFMLGSHRARRVLSALQNILHCKKIKR
jgi:hypothetical protein